MGEPTSPEARRASLARTLANLSAAGWRVESQSDFRAVVVKKEWVWLERRQIVEVDALGNPAATDPVANQGGEKVKRIVVKGGVVVVGVLVVLGIIGAILGSSEDPSTTSGQRDTGTKTNAAPTTVSASLVTGKIAGVFHRDCFGCGDLKVYIRTSDVWCGWRDETVVVHVRMTNESVEHVTVNWHPSYVIRGGAEHGAGLGSIQDDGFDAGQTRVLVAEQQPEGVAPGAALSECKPSFFLIESG
ncbi:MAG: hypothetical protein ACKVUT_14190 [Gaiella sp.]